MFPICREGGEGVYDVLTLQKSRGASAHLGGGGGKAPCHPPLNAALSMHGIAKAGHSIVYLPLRVWFNEVDVFTSGEGVTDTYIAEGRVSSKMLLRVAFETQEAFLH